MTTWPHHLSDLISSFYNNTFVLLCRLRISHDENIYESVQTRDTDDGVTVSPKILLPSVSVTGLIRRTCHKWIISPCITLKSRDKSFENWNKYIYLVSFGVWKRAGWWVCLAAPAAPGVSSLLPVGNIEPVIVKVTHKILRQNLSKTNYKALKPLI